MSASEGTARNPPAPDGFTVSTSMVSGAAVVTLCGRWHRHTYPSCRDAVLGLLSRRPLGVVLDLRRVQLVDDVLPVCEALRRLVGRAGTTLWLAGVPFQLAQDLRSAGLDQGYRWAVTVEAAVQAVTDAPRRRPGLGASSGPGAPSGPGARSGRLP